MTVGKTRPTKLRLTFNFRSGTKMTERIRGFAAVLVEDVAMNVADEKWQEVKAKIAGQLETDVQREINWMAQQFKQYTIGLPAGRSGLAGTLTTASATAKGQEGHSTFSLGDGPWAHWAPRGGRNYYLAWKQRHFYHKRWFDATRLLHSTMGKGGTWTGAFGGVKVDVQRTESMSVQDATRIANSQMTPGLKAERDRRFGHGVNSGGLTMRVSVCSIRVSAMQAITPAMLPVLRTNTGDEANIGNVAPDGRKTGLIGMFPGEVAMHLAGSSQAKNFVPYRHTIEPFLGFLLTRAIPNAVARRIQEGLGQDIQAGGESSGPRVKSSRFNR